MTIKLVSRAMLATAFTLCFAFSTSAVAAKDNSHNAGQITAMSQNLYIGAEILPIALAPGLCELMGAADVAVQQVLANDFSQRADALAALIAAEQPHVVGLQEVFQVILTDLAGNPIFFDDYLTQLMAALNGHGASYYEAAARWSTPITVPADSDGDCDPNAPSLGAADYAGTVRDRDVILCRDDVDCGSPASAIFQVNAGAITPAGELLIERGWVSVVATIKGRNYRILNTHLETDGNADFRAVQFGQAVELAATLDFLRQDGLPQVALGDFNSDDTPGLPDCGAQVPCFTSYQIMTAAGFHDAWLWRVGRPENGYTCCEDEDLRNEDSALSRRIDHIWVRESATHYGGPVLRGVRADVLGTMQSDRSHPDGLWPSDHATVVADMVLRVPK